MVHLSKRLKSNSAIISNPGFVLLNIKLLLQPNRYDVLTSQRAKLIPAPRLQDFAWINLKDHAVSRQFDNGKRAKYLQLIGKPLARSLKAVLRDMLPMNLSDKSLAEYLFRHPSIAASTNFLPPISPRFFTMKVCTVTQF
jgi:hypothetical protein